MAVGTILEPAADPRASLNVELAHKGPVAGERVFGLKARVDPTVTFEEYQ